MQIKVTVEIYDGAAPIRTEVACLEREVLSNESCGLTMNEAKALLANVQQAMVGAQVTAQLQANSACPDCGRAYTLKDKRSIVVRSLFGKLRLPSPRYNTCGCQKAGARQSFSPLTLLLTERTTPEFRYLQCKWSALLSFGLSSQLLSDVLPIEKPVSTAVLSRQVQRIAERFEHELGAEKELFGWEDGVSRANLPHPAPPISVGIDGGWVHGREGTNRKAGSFEVIVGKSIPAQGAVRRLGFVNGYDRKPRRRLFEVLRSQGGSGRRGPLLSRTSGKETLLPAPPPLRSAQDTHRIMPLKPLTRPVEDAVAQLLIAGYGLAYGNLDVAAPGFLPVLRHLYSAQLRDGCASRLSC